MEECLDDINEVLEPQKRRKKRAVIDRRSEEGNIRLFNDYFSENAIYPEAIFRRRFRMNRPLFMRIVNKLSELHYFTHLPDADAVDEYLRLGASTALKCLHKFVNAIILFYEKDLPQKAYTSRSQTITQGRREVDFPAQ
ncbi:unnamed protein product [Microthlaspi erraticum]|uniref:Uncharacterized protein n=1 Tax=Microthlaspi erraticum TaxID=1685480 RepID=A0A6D2HIU5_9BRAS|nr:unnamed protein product [Microthlaspi erraticum]